MIPYSSTSDKVAEFYNSNTEIGLTLKQTQELLLQKGKNKLKETKKKPLAIKFLEQFKDVMIMILIGAAVISFIMACVSGHAREFIEPAVILFIIIANAIIGLIQENKAEKALDALKNMSAPKAKVVRDGKEILINAEDLVPGDIINLEAGDFVPADARLITSSSLKSEESALTGESVPSEKNSLVTVEEQTPLAERINMVFSGCSVTYGTAKAIVTGTGMDTEIGKIADLLNSEKSVQTPLQKKLAKLGKYLGIVALAACAVIFVVGLIAKLEIMELFMTAVSLAVSAIPEGLPAVITIVLSIGVQRMVKKNAIIKRLPAVETLGGATVICSDKTGTLTQNRMTLTKAFCDEDNDVSDISASNAENIRKLLLYGTLCSNGSVNVENGKEVLIGDPTETSIISAALKNGIDKNEINNLYPRLLELPFDSDRKLMSCVNNINGKNIVIVKGAFDMLENICIKGDIEKAKKLSTKLSMDALRVIGIAYKEIKTVPKDATPQSLENNLTFMGFVGMIDPPRPEAKEAVKICKIAGIRPVMITGDHITTATAIAKEIGIFNDGDETVTGVELAKMSDEELANRIQKISVYARVSPTDKIRIVKAWQKLDKVVAMTGDGVNDAPALKAADIGCAMGITGTDVAKSAADITLTDDNFATIVDAVKEGRGIYDNIKKVVGFLLGTNIGEIIVVFMAMLIWQQTPLVSMQLLWINLVTDSMPAIALGMENIEGDIMNRKPKCKNESLFANGYGIKIILQGMMFGGISILGFWLGWHLTGTLEGGRTVAFIALSLSQVFHAYDMRTHKSLLKTNPFSNKNLNLAALAAIALVAFVLFIPPIAFAFELVALPLKCYLIGLGLAFTPFVVMELSKIFKMVLYRNK